MVRILLKKEAAQGLNGNAVVLRPGLNEIPVEDWEKVANLELTKLIIGEGIITVVEEEAAPVSEPHAEPAPVAEVDPVSDAQPTQPEPAEEEAQAAPKAKGRKGRR